MSDLTKVARRAGGWCITMGIVSVAVGVAVGVGCIIAGGRLIAHS